MMFEKREKQEGEEQEHIPGAGAVPPGLPSSLDCLDGNYCARSPGSVLIFSLLIGTAAYLFFLVPCVLVLYFVIGVTKSWVLLTALCVLCAAVAVICGRAMYGTQISEGLYVNNEKVTLVRRDRVRWQCALGDVESVGVEHVEGNPIAVLVTTEGKHFRIPWALIETHGRDAGPLSSDLYPPFALLLEKDIPLTPDIEWVREHTPLSDRGLQVLGILFFATMDCVLTFLFFGKS